MLLTARGTAVRKQSSDKKTVNAPAKVTVTMTVAVAKMIATANETAVR